MARLQARSLTVPDEVRSFRRGRVDIYDLGDIVVGRMVFGPGWHWAEQVKHIAGTELCEYHHIGVASSGQSSCQAPGSRSWSAEATSSRASRESDRRSSWASRRASDWTRSCHEPAVDLASGSGG
jgi:hypothetical protein